MRLDAIFREDDQSFDVSLFGTPRLFQSDFGEVQTLTEFVGGDPYVGDYAVTPKVEAQTMPTKNKVMLDDMTIREIPVYEVSNTSGGSTVYIAKEV